MPESGFDLREEAHRRVRGRISAAGADVLSAWLAACLVAAAFVVPLLADERWRRTLYAGAAPIFGGWLAHVGWGTVPAIVIAGLVIGYGPGIARRLPWPRLLVATWSTSVGWAFCLAMVDGWQRGFAGRLTTSDEYLSAVGGVSDIPATVRGFSARILDFQPDSWPTHVSGHPPGALLFFVLLDRIGLGGGGLASLACLLVGCSAATAVLVTLRALGADGRARAAAPFLALAPAAVWLAVSADAIFAGVAAWAVALLALAAARRNAWLGVGSGLLFGVGIYLNYGLVLMAIPAVTVPAAARTVRPLLPAVVGALAVVAVFTAGGFWWFDGYHIVVERYYQGIADERPYSYWVWANLAATVCAVGLATAAALHRAVSPTRLRALDPTSLLVGAAVCAIIAADLTGLSKAETERIWLSFDVWLLAATGFLPERAKRWWLALQAVATLVLVHTILTNW